MLTKVLPLEFRVNANQRQHVVLPRRQACEYRIVVLQITLGAAKAGGQQHAHAPAPAFGDIQAAQRWGDQGHTDQAVVDQQTDGRQIFSEMLLHQFTYRGAYALVVAWPLGFEDIGKRWIVTIGVVQQRARLASIAPIERTDFSGTVWHTRRPLLFFDLFGPRPR
ncbi:hypothetical protein D9M68_828350 [compost metagenome]